MKNAVISVLLIPLLFISCISDETEKLAPTLEKDKKILFQFFTDQDYSSPEFDTYFVNLNIGISLMETKTGHELKVLEESTGWIPFKDIPQADQKIVFEKSMKVDVHKYSVLYSYSHQVRIGETIQMKAIGEFLRDSENEKLITIKF